MASQTKVGPSDSTPPAPASGVEASMGVDSELGDDAGEPTSHVASMLSETDGQPGDDEDVSLDELMISGEEDESEEATDAQGVIARPTDTLDAPAPVSEPTAVEAASRELDAAPDGAAAFAFDSPEDDEAAAAAAQEAAAQ